MSEEVEFIHLILAETELAMRERLRSVGVDLPHLLVAAGPSGNTLILGTMDAELLKKVCSDLIERADQELQRRSAHRVLPCDATALLNAPVAAGAEAAVRK